MQMVLIILAAVSGTVLIGALTWPLVVQYQLFQLKIKRLKAIQSQPSYDKIDQFLDPAEVKLYQSLKQVMGSGLSVYPQVRLASLLKLRKGSEQLNPQLANFIRNQAVDFAVCDSTTQQPILVVILQNSQASSEKDKINQARVQQVLADAKLAMLPISRQHMPNSLQLAQSLKTASTTFMKQQANAA